WDAESVVDLVGHLVPVGELTARRVSRCEDGLQVGECGLSSDSSKDRVGEVIRRQLAVLVRRPARSPAVAVARPADLVRGELILTAAAFGCKARRDDDRILELARQECGGDGGAEVVVGVAARAVNHDHRAGDLLVLLVHSIRAIDQRAAGPAADRDPFRAFLLRDRARRGVSRHRRREADENTGGKDQRAFHVADDTTLTSTAWRLAPTCPCALYSIQPQDMVES